MTAPLRRTAALCVIAALILWTGLAGALLLLSYEGARLAFNG